MFIVQNSTSNSTQSVTVRITTGNYSYGRQKKRGKIRCTECIERIPRLSDDTVVREVGGLRGRDHLAEALVFPSLAFAYIFFSRNGKLKRAFLTLKKVSV